jgi:polyhydroxyalkanoate synthesis regulator phasin
MNSNNNLLELVHTGFRVSLGATTSLVETLQDPQKREENLSQLQTELNERVSEWAAKGETTEREARSFIEQMLGQPSSSQTAPTAPPPSTAPTPPPRTTVTPTIQSEIAELTVQIAMLRTELEQLREPDSE